jgi:chromosomal replication initiator protein
VIQTTETNLNMQRPLPLTFARFIEAPENRSALAAVQRVVTCLCSSASRSVPNPLYVHGPAGTGKTHLVSALVAEVTRRSPALVISTSTASDFDILPSSEKSPGEDEVPFQAARQSDLVIVEDVQHLHSRAAEACLQLFDRLQARQVPMVFTAAVGPRWLKLPARLTSRLASGLVVGLEPLQTASRLALLQERTQRRQLAVRADILAWLAEHLNGARQMEGALASLETLSRIHGRGLDVATVAQHFQKEADATRPSVERIARHVGSYFRVEPRDLQSSQRCRNVLLPRQVGMYLARQLTALSFEQIGSYFGGRDHTTVLHACRKVEQALVHDPVLSGTVRQLRSELA